MATSQSRNILEVVHIDVNYCFVSTNRKDGEGLEGEKVKTCTDLI